MREHRPTGSRVTALEALVLKLRAYEMVLALHYVEDLRRHVLTSLQATDKLTGTSKFPAQGRMAGARKVLVEDGILTQSESDEFHDLITYRNLIAHGMPQLTADVGPHAHLAGLDAGMLDPVPAYQQDVLKRVTALRARVFAGTQARYVLQVSFRPLMFEAAEKVYKAEIAKLRRRVLAGIQKFNAVVDETNAVIKGLPSGLLDELEPGHPKQRARNGTLTASGLECVERLFQGGATPLAVSYLMRVGLPTAQAWHRRWAGKQAASGPASDAHGVNG